MTMKEIEQLSGMTRANIRFYEAEGLLSPERASNGYRDYSDNDLEILKRIKLLRTIHISLEEIKSLHTGDCELVDALEQHLAKLELDRADLENSQEICKVMRNDGVRYQTLDAQRYLDAMESGTRSAPPDLMEDALAVVRTPWRRFFARGFDFFVYDSLWAIFLSAVFNINFGTRSAGENLLDIIAGMLLMLFIEPALLSHFGTTAGKFILGLRVTDNEDCLLSYSDALSRTWKVFCSGLGLNLPIYSLVRQWKSYKACSEGETLEWEYYSMTSLKDEKSWRNWCYVGAYAIVIGILFLAFSMVQMPKHRGEITVSQFCENYNRLSDYFELDPYSYLDDTGKWQKVETGDYIVTFSPSEKPEYIFTAENGVMTGMEFSVEIKDSDVWVPNYQNEMLLSIMSFVQAQKGCGPLSGEVKKVANNITKAPFKDFHYTLHGVELICDFEFSGYIEDSTYTGVLWHEEGSETSFKINFKMAKV